MRPTCNREMESASLSLGSTFMKLNPKDRLSYYFSSEAYSKLYAEYFSDGLIIPKILIGYKDFDWIKEHNPNYLNAGDKRNSKKKYGFKVILPDKHIK